MRDRGGAVHLHRGAVAALVHRPSGQSGGGPPAWKGFNYTYHFFWGSRTSSPSSPTCGARSRPTNPSAALFPNDGDGNAWGDKVVGFPPVLEKGGYKLTDPGRYQNLTDNFSAADRRVQGRPIARSSPAWCCRRISPRSGNEASSKASSRRSLPIGKAILFPVAGRGARQGRPQSVLGGLVVAQPSLQVVAHRHERQGSRRRLSGRDQQAVDAADRLHPRVVRSRRRRARSARPTVTPKRSRRPSLRPISTRSSARCNGAVQTCRRSLPRTLRRRRWSAVSGGSRIGKYDIVITDNKTAPAIPVGGQMEAIA